MAELGNLTVLYSPPSLANVNCENPRRKPVSQLDAPDSGFGSRFPKAAGPIFLRPPQDPSFLHRMYTASQGFRLA